MGLIMGRLYDGYLGNVVDEGGIYTNEHPVVALQCSPKGLSRNVAVKDRVVHQAGPS